MIIFDLDSTLADCEHRCHFVDAKKNPEFWPVYCKPFDYMNPQTGELWKPQWKAFYEACDKDGPIQHVWKVFDHLAVDNDIEIWSGRCESVRDKTLKWLYENCPYSGQTLKMRTIGNCTPDDELKEMWLNAAIILEGKKIDFVFDGSPKVVRMWRRHGIFVFDCCQHEGKK